MSDEDLTFATSAFAAALPSVEYRPGNGRAPRRHRRGPAAIAASVGTVAVVAVTTTALMSTGGQAPTAWSATPKHLSAAASDEIDKQCRAASVDQPQVVPSERPRTGEAPGPRIERNESTSARGSSVKADNGKPTVTHTGPGSAPQITKIGDLPLILVDARGEMSLALYGNAEHHIVCSLLPGGLAMLTPDEGSWPTGHLLDPASAFGNAVLKGDGTASTSLRLLGTTAPNVEGITVDVPDVGPVEATVRNGHYALFVPQEVLKPTDRRSLQLLREYPAHVTTSDGTVHDTTMVLGERIDREWNTSTS